MKISVRFVFYLLGCHVPEFKFLGGLSVVVDVVDVPEQVVYGVL